MKLIIFAIVLLLAGLSGISDPENVGVSIICILAGIAIIIYKIASGREQQRKREEAEEFIRNVEQEHREAEYRAEVARKTWEEQEKIRLEKSESWHAVHNKWQVITDEHAKLLNEIGVAYTIANNLNLPDSPQMQHVIELCKKDIALAEMFQKSQAEIQQVRIANGWADANEPTKSITSFPTFKRLAIIYEKQKDYDSAIAVCQRAIELGYADDGTDGQMPGRIARLMRKKGKTSKKIEPAEEVVIDDVSGDIIES